MEIKIKETDLVKRKNKLSFKKIVPYFYVLPAALLVTVFFIMSAIFTFSLSFTKLNIRQSIPFSKAQAKS
ncbi:hypothetical protein, partial [Thomasclavelia ramosa]|uniref:hypothetical protein n=1 Tax=Thomasclavelia ramosa TaxID=1547 RepID=UPI001D05D47B